MIPKLVTHAGAREKAMDAQAEGLDEFVIDGIRHNIPFLSALMTHPRWRAGKLSTGFIAEEFPNGFHPHPPEGETAKLLAAVAAAADHVLGERKRQISGQMNGRRVTRESRREIVLGERAYILDVEAGTLNFGDGEYGRTPPDGRMLRLTYRGGAGEQGNFKPEVLTVEPQWKP